MALVESLPNEGLRVGHLFEEPNRGNQTAVNYGRFLSLVADVDFLGAPSAQTSQINNDGAANENLYTPVHGEVAMPAATSVKIQYGLLEKGFAGAVALILALIGYMGVDMRSDVKELRTNVSGIHESIAVTNTKLDATNKSLDELSQKAGKTNDQLNTLMGRLPPTLRP